MYSGSPHAYSSVRTLCKARSQSIIAVFTVVLSGVLLLYPSFEVLNATNFEPGSPAMLLGQ